LGKQIEVKIDFCPTWKAPNASFMCTMLLGRELICTG